MSRSSPNEFTCPICGGHYYGTTYPNIPGVDLRSPIALLIGYCKGAPVTKNGKLVYKGGYRGCTFTWSRADDAKYGLRNHGAEPGAVHGRRTR